MKILKRIIKILLILILLVALLFLYARFVEPNLLTVKTMSLKAGTKIVDFKIVFFSDTHFGRYYPQEKIVGIVEKINAENADIVVFGGDYFDAYYRDEAQLDAEYLATQMKLIKSKYGAFAVWGNHDYGGGSIRIYEDFMADSGFTLLKNSSTHIPQLDITITGLDDYQFGHPDTDTTRLSSDDYNIFISHAPLTIEGLGLDKISLMLSGHSHGGQVSLPFLTERVLPSGVGKYVKGMFDFDSEADTKLFVSNGIGVSQMPLRFGNVPEINVFEVSGEK